jgi:hypothetical protein
MRVAAASAGALLASAAHAEPVAAGTVGEAWRVLAPEEGRFRALLPGAPHAEHRSRRTLFGRLREAVFETDADGRRFAVELYDLPGPARWVVPDRLILERARAGLLEDMAATELSGETISLDGHPGRSVLYRYVEGGDRIEEGRFYLVGSRLYLVVAGRRDAERLDPDARRFFDSFRAWPADEAPPPG